MNEIPKFVFFSQNFPPIISKIKILSRTIFLYSNVIHAVKCVLVFVKIVLYVPKLNSCIAQTRNYRSSGHLGVEEETDHFTISESFSDKGLSKVYPDNIGYILQKKSNYFKND